jgi:hypothetical protein
VGGTHRVVHVAAAEGGRGVAGESWWVVSRVGGRLAVVPLLKPDSLQQATLGCGGRSRAVEGDHGVSSEQAASVYALTRYVAAVALTSKEVDLLTDGELRVLPLDLPRVFSG